jgi:hypothetical protein
VRIINIMENNEIRVGITLRAQPVPWTPIAKDAGLLPQRDRTLRPSYVRTSVGETYDFAFTPTEPGDYFLEVSRLSGVVQRQLWRVTEP